VVSTLLLARTGASVESMRWRPVTRNGGTSWTFETPHYGVLKKGLGTHELGRRTLEQSALWQAIARSPIRCSGTPRQIPRHIFHSFNAQVRVYFGDCSKIRPRGNSS
jgi:hypothetical protein